MKKTHYDVLGLDPKKADLTDIKKAFKKLALQHHPDRVPPEMKETAAEMFRTIREAFDVLSCGPSKLRYDTEMRLKIPERPEPKIQSTLTSYSNSSFDSGAHGFHFPDDLDAEYIAKIFAEEYMYSQYNFDRERTPMRHARRPKNNYNNVAAEDGNYFNKNLVAGRAKRNIDGFSVKRHWRKPAKQPKDKNYKVTPEDGYCFNKNLVAGRAKRNIDGFSVKRHWRKPAKQPTDENYKVTPEDGYCFNKNLVAGRVKRNLDGFSVKRHWRKPAKHRMLWCTLSLL